MEYKEPKRARRIRARERMIEKARRLAREMDPIPHSCVWTDVKGNTRNSDTWKDLYEWHHTWAVHNYQNLAACSCYMCGNPRKHWHTATIQEIKAVIDAVDQLSEVGIHYRRRFKTSPF